VNVVIKEDSKSDDGDIIYVSSNLDHLTDSWILDLSCFYHMAPNKDWFDTFKLVNSSSIMMGNDALCKVVGMRNVKIKMFNDVIIILCYVRHISYLRKNMILLGTLDHNGFSFKFESKVIKVL